MEPWIALPTWFLVRCALPYFREDHPWRLRPRFFTLDEWAAGQTPLCRAFDFVFWLLGSQAAGLWLGICFRLAREL